MQASTITPTTIDTTVTRMAFTEVTQLTDMLAAAERRLRQARAALTEICPEPEDLARAGSVSVPTVLLGALAAMDADILTTIAQVERTLRHHRHAGKFVVDGMASFASMMSVAPSPLPVAATAPTDMSVYFAAIRQHR